MAGRTVYFLGDSVLRDLAVSFKFNRLGASSKGDEGPEEAIDERLRAKKGCRKTYNNERESACAMTYSSSEGRFMWLQWLRAPHRIPWGLAPGRGTGYQQQEMDACCAWVAHQPNSSASAPSNSSGLRGCLAALLRGATARDVVVMRTGLNYPLYDPGVAYESEALRDWRADLQGDLQDFLGEVLPAVFPGTVVLWQLDSGVGRPGVQAACNEEGALHRLAPLLPQARALQAAVAARHMAAGPLKGRLFTVDPSNIIASEEEMGRLYADCLHHGPALQNTLGNALLAVLLQARMPA